MFGHVVTGYGLETHVGFQKTGFGDLNLFLKPHFGNTTRGAPRGGPMDQRVRPKEVQAIRTRFRPQSLSDNRIIFLETGGAEAMPRAVAMCSFAP
jgi:hypothetical protein